MLDAEDNARSIVAAHEALEKIHEMDSLLLRWYEESTKNYRSDLRQLHHDTGSMIKPEGWIDQVSHHSSESDTKLHVEKTAHRLEVNELRMDLAKAEKEVAELRKCVADVSALDNINLALESSRQHLSAARHALGAEYGIEERTIAEGIALLMSDYTSEKRHVLKLIMEGLAVKNERDEAIMECAEKLKPCFCGVAGHFKFQQNVSSCLMCQRERNLVNSETALIRAERDELRAVLARANPPPERAYECLAVLEAAGMGAPLAPHGNTLTGMVKEACEKITEMRGILTMWERFRSVIDALCLHRNPPDQNVQDAS